MKKNFRLSSTQLDSLKEALEGMENSTLQLMGDDITGGIRIHSLSHSESGGHSQTHSQTGNHGQSHGLTNG
jgi:hypothetical protein